MIRRAVRLPAAFEEKTGGRAPGKVVDTGEEAGKESRPAELGRARKKPTRRYTMKKITVQVRRTTLSNKSMLACKASA